MLSPRITVNPAIVGAIAAASKVGNLQKSISWPPQQPLFSFQPGTGSGQMDEWFDDIRTLADGANESLDLSGSSQADFTGVALAFAHVKLLGIYADPANTTDLTVGNGTNPFLGALGAGANTLILKPGELHMFVRPVTGYPVVGGASDILKIANGAGAAAKYTILIGGTSV